jgi:hypothetical protein
MSAESPGGADPSQSPVTSVAEQNRQLLVWSGYLCGTLAFVFWPLILGPAGFIIGAINRRTGDKDHGEKQMGLGLFGLVGGLVIGMLFGGFSDSTYVSECRSLWDRQSRSYPAVDVSYRRVGNGELTRFSDDRLVGYYTDFIVTLKFDNFGKKGQINLQCVANSQKTFVYMKTDDSNWIGGTSGPIGVSFTLANGRLSVFPPDLD